MGLCLLHLPLLILRVSDVLCPLVLRVEGLRFFFRAFLLGASLPSVHELSQTLPNGAVDNHC